MDKVRKEIADRLKQARIKAGYKTAKEFVEQHQLSASAYGHHENGTRGIRPDVVNKYSALLNINPGWLFSGQSFRDASAVSLSGANDIITIDEGFALIQYIYKNIHATLNQIMSDKEFLIDRSFLLTATIYKQIIRTHATFDELMKAAESAVNVARETMAVTP